MKKIGKSILKHYRLQLALPIAISGGGEWAVRIILYFVLDVVQRTLSNPVSVKSPFADVWT